MVIVSGCETRIDSCNDFIAWLHTFTVAILLTRFMMALMLQTTMSKASYAIIAFRILTDLPMMSAIKSDLFFPPNQSQQEQTEKRGASLLDYIIPCFGCMLHFVSILFGTSIPTSFNNLVKMFLLLFHWFLLCI